MDGSKIDRCVCCGGSDLFTYLDLGEQPLANSFHDGTETLPAYPLAVNLCRACFHSQLTFAVNPDALFKHYLYVSGTTKTLHEYFESFADRVTALYPEKKLAVLDIASNDGTLLSVFGKRGHDVLGVDPAENLAPLAEKNGVPTHVGYWGAETADAIGRDFDVIVAMNVLGHISTPLQFLRAAAKVLRPGGRVFIQVSQAKMQVNGEFDTVYHEHHSFFTSRSFTTLADRAGLQVVSGRHVPVHGTSFLWELMKTDDAADGSVPRMTEEEERLGYYSMATYEKFQGTVAENAARITELVRNHRAQGGTVLGYGAAAKGNTFLNYPNLDFDYIVDDNPMKWDLKTPGMNIPIVGPEILETFDKPCVILALSWNFFEEIQQRVKRIRPGFDDTFVRYFPKLEIVNGSTEAE